MLERRFENVFEASKCENPTERPCPIYLKSILSLKSTLSIIGNVSSSTGILMLHGQNDSGSRVQQAFLLQQRLIELNRPDHSLITYPNLGHHFLSFISVDNRKWTHTRVCFAGSLCMACGSFRIYKSCYCRAHLYYRPGSCSFKGRPNLGLASKIFNEIQRL